MASEDKTAIAEVRPWIGAQVSVGTFEIQRDLRVVNFSDCVHELQFSKSGDYSKEAREEKAWADVNVAFRLPVTRNDDQASYAPTQVIADMFKAKGLDGIAYGSAVGKGINLALFDLDCVKMVSSNVFVVTNLIVEAEYDTSAYCWHAPDKLQMQEPSDADDSVTEND